MLSLRWHPLGMASFATTESGQYRATRIRRRPPPTDGLLWLAAAVWRAHHRSAPATSRSLRMQGSHEPFGQAASALRAEGGSVGAAGFGRSSRVAPASARALASCEQALERRLAEARGVGGEWAAPVGGGD